MERILDVWEVARAAGWDAACALCDATFQGWEVEFLGVALGLLAAVERDQERLEDHRFWAQVLGGGRGS